MKPTAAKKTSKRLIYLSLSLTFILVGLYLSLPWLLSSLIAKATEDQTFDISWQIKHPTLKSLTFPQVIIKTQQWQLQATNIKLHFNLKQLFKNQQLKAVDIDNLTLNLLSTSKESEPTLDLHPFLPKSWWTTPKANRLTIKQLNIHQKAWPTPITSWSGQIHTDWTQGFIQINATGIDNQQQTWHIETKLQANNEWQNTLNLSSKDITLTLNSKDKQQGTHINQHGTLALKINKIPTWLNKYISPITKLSGYINLNWQSSIPLKLDLTELPYPSNTKLTANLNTQLNATTNTPKNTQGTLKWQSTLNYQDKKLIAQIAPNSRTTITTDLKNYLTKNQLANWSQSSILDTIIKNKDKLTLTLSTDKSLHIKSTSDISLNAQSNDSKLNIPHLAINGKILPTLSLNTELHVNGKLHNTPLPSPKLKAKINYNNKNHTTNGTWELTPITANQLTPGESLPAGKEKLPIKFTQGTLAAKGQFTLNKKQQLHQKLEITTNKLSGKYEDLTFKELTTTAQLSNTPAWRLTKTAPIHLSKAQIGKIHPENITLSVHPTPTLNKVLIKDLQTNLWKGHITTPQVYWAPNHTEHFAVTVNNLSVDEIIKAHQIVGLSGNGAISGVLPVILNKNGLTIDEGKLKAHQPGGIIRYTPDTGAQQVIKSYAQLNIPALALKNFHYNILEGDIGLQPSGQLIAKLRLSGQNPEFNAGQKINLNINIENNLGPLLKSLEIVDDIESRVKKRYQK